MSTCTVCERVIAHQLLMCSKHWRLVPAAQQSAVYAAFGVCVRTSVKNPTEWAAARKAHHEACDAATAAAKAAALNTGEQLPRPGDVAEFVWRI